MTKWTSGPWEYIPSTEHHGPYVSGPYSGDICDCYTMSNLSALSVRNGGDSRPIHHQGECADANARLIAAAPSLYEALERCLAYIEVDETAHGRQFGEGNVARAALRAARGEPDEETTRVALAQTLLDDLSETGER